MTLCIHYLKWHLFFDLCLGRGTEAKVKNLLHKVNKIECSEEKSQGTYSVVIEKQVLVICILQVCI